MEESPRGNKKVPRRQQRRRELENKDEAVAVTFMLPAEHC